MTHTLSDAALPMMGGQQKSLVIIMPKTRVAILGMHRGGTSATAKVIKELGFFMGDELLPPSKTNKAGYYEDKQIMMLNDNIIGSNWLSPLIINAFTSRLMLAKRLRDVFDVHDRWAIKDPRLCYTLPIIRELYPNIMVVSVYRNPWHAAMSLSEREGIPFRAALTVSLKYLAEMISNTTSKSVRVHRIRFEELLFNTRRCVTKLALWLGVPVNDEAVNAVDKSLVTWETMEIERHISRLIADGKLGGDAWKEN